MLRVELIKTFDVISLQNKINDFIKNRKVVTVNTTMSPSSSDAKYQGDTQYLATILYEY